MHVVSCYPSFLDQAASIVYCTVVARLWSKVVLIQVEDYLDLDRCKAICEQLCSYMPRIEYSQNLRNCTLGPHSGSNDHVNQSGVG